MFSISLTELSSIACAALQVNAHFLAPVAIVLGKISILSGVGGKERESFEEAKKIIKVKSEL